PCTPSIHRHDFDAHEGTRLALGARRDMWHRHNTKDRRNLPPSKPGETGTRPACYATSWPYLAPICTACVRRCGNKPRLGDCGMLLSSNVAGGADFFHARD